LPNNGNPTYGRTTDARDMVWRIGHDRGSGGAPEAWKTYKTKTPQSGDCGVFDLVAGTCNHLKLLFEAAA
jgi:hypothetical protein